MRILDQLNYVKNHVVCNLDNASSLERAWRGIIKYFDTCKNKPTPKILNKLNKIDMLVSHHDSVELYTNVSKLCREIETILIGETDEQINSVN